MHEFGKQLIGFGIRYFLAEVHRNLATGKVCVLLRLVAFCRIWSTIGSVRAWTYCGFLPSCFSSDC